MRKQARIMVGISPELRAIVEEKAKQSGNTMSGVVVEMIKASIKTSPYVSNDNIEARIDKAIEQRESELREKREEEKQIGFWKQGTILNEAVRYEKVIKERLMLIGQYVVKLDLCKVNENMMENNVKRCIMEYERYKLKEEGIRKMIINTADESKTFGRERTQNLEMHDIRISQYTNFIAELKEILHDSK